MPLFVGVTGGDWFRHLAAIPAIDEVNVRQPSGSSQFRALAPGEVFLFKLHSPRNVILGGGVFAHMSRLHVSLAWGGRDPGLRGLVGEYCSESPFANSGSAGALARARNQHFGVRGGGDAGPPGDFLRPA
jgi:hypothetical protein